MTSYFASRLALIGGLSVVGLVAAALVGIVALGQEPALPWHRSPPLPGTTGYAYQFADLLTEPDAIVEGIVEASGPGRTVGEAASALQFTETALRITAVHTGAIAERVLVETDVPYEVAWQEPGSRVLAFLWLKRDPESAGRYYRLISPEGVALVDGSALRPGLLSDVSAPLRNMTLDEFVAYLRTSHP